MSRYYTLHPENPQRRVVRQAVDALKSGALIAYPTDSSYALGCCIDNRQAVQTMRKIRNLHERHPLTLICSDIAQAAAYAHIDNFAFSFLKQLTPGAFTFVLPSTKKVPKTVAGSKRKVVGIRIPCHPVAHLIVEELGEPLLSSTLLLPGEELPIQDPHEIVHSSANCVDLILDAGWSEQLLTSIVEIIGNETNIIRRGAGDLSLFE